MTVVIMVAAVAVAATDEKQQDAVPRFIATSQAANLSQLEYGSFTFDLVTGTARGPEQALRGEIEVSSRASGSYVFEAENAVYRCLYDEADLKAGVSVDSASRFRLKHMSIQALTDRKSTCLDVKSIVDPAKGSLGHSVEIFPDADQSYFRSYFLFVQPLGFRDRATRFTSELPLLEEKKTRVSELNMDFQRDGRQMIRVVFETEAGLKRAYTVDPVRGCLPMATENYDEHGRLGTMAVLGDVFHCADRCWLPKSMVLYNAMNGTAKLMRMTGFEVSKKPRSSDFQLSFDEKVVIPDSVKQVVYQDLSGISLRDLKALKASTTPARFIKPLAGNAIGAPALPGELENSPRHAFIVAIGLVSAAVLVCAIWLRKRWIR
ncbi:hypothetical protein [Aquisphaera insulae]|uniref:hypothetical protein n=1 Tax=Aquisphaera insulae TaxID=2712864 RepID=UPI0013EE2404|nr:hypothetical protein [Aquisphaera insulae]